MALIVFQLVFIQKTFPPKTKITINNESGKKGIMLYFIVYLVYYIIMNNKNDFESISNHLYRVFTKFNEVEKNPRDFGVKSKLYPSEIHMVQAIGRNQGINLTELAQSLGITKGAVPKKIRKLESKNLVKRYRKEENKKEIYFFLTDDGKVAYERHEAFHAMMDNHLFDLFNSLNEKEQSIIITILDELEKFADSAK